MSAPAGPERLFGWLCAGLEKIQGLTKRDHKLKVLRAILDQFGRNPADIHHLMRLLCPEFDKERRPFGIKDRTLTSFYMHHLQLSRSSGDGRMLDNWKDRASIVPGSDVVAGDLYSVLRYVLQNRCRSSTPTATIKDVNDMLDALYHSAGGSKEEKFKALQRIFHNTTEKEQVFIARIVLSERGKSEMKLGLGSESILKAYHPNAVELYNVCHKLRRVCEDPEGILGISLKLCVKPMLASSKDPIEIPPLMGVPTKCSAFFMDPKMDGERLQIHYDASTGEYCLYSRQATDYTERYGPRLCKFFKTHLAASVRDVILDGELMTYDTQARQFLRFGQAKTVAALGDDDPRRLCFIAFDVMLLNGQNVMGKTLQERRSLLEGIVRSEEAVFQVVKTKQGQTEADIKECLEQYCAQGFEGVVVKSALSPYVPGQRKTNWVKVKPEYVIGMYDEIDTVVLGGYYGEGWRAAEGGVSTMLVGVGDEKSRDADGNFTKFHVLTKVGTGYSYEELKLLRERLRGNLHKLDRNVLPPYIPQFRVPGQPMHSIEWPDEWVVDPLKSIVLEVKAAEITEAERMPFGYNLRFPRVTAIRSASDKPPNQCTTGKMLVEMRKMALTHKRTALPGNQAAKKRRRVAKPAGHSIGILGSSLTAVVSKVVAKTRLFSDYDFCVMIPDTPSNQDVRIRAATCIKEHGGRISLDLSNATTHIVAVDASWLKVANAIRQMQSGFSEDRDVVRPDWVFDCAAVGGLVQLEPKYLVYESQETHIQMGEVMDVFGDHFTERLDSSGLEMVLRMVGEKERNRSQNQSLADILDSVPELAEPEDHMFGCMEPEDVKALRGPLQLFWDCVAFDTTHNQDPEVPNPMSVALVIFRRYGGQVSTQPSKCTHLFLDNDPNSPHYKNKDHLDLAMRYQLKVVTVEWLEDCINRDRQVDCPATP